MAGNLSRVFLATTSTSVCRSNFCFSRHFLAQPWTAVTPLISTADNKIFGNCDAFGDQGRQSGGAVSWVLRDKECSLIDKGNKWFSGLDFANNTYYLELLGIETLVRSIPKKYMGFVIEIYCDDPAAIYFLELVKNYYDKGYSLAGINARVWESYRPSQNLLNTDMVKVAYDLCMLMQNFHPSSQILKVARGDNLVADGIARYARGFVSDKEVFLGDSISTGVVV